MGRDKVSDAKGRQHPWRMRHIPTKWGAREDSCCIVCRFVHPLPVGVHGVCVMSLEYPPSVHVLGVDRRLPSPSLRRKVGHGLSPALAAERKPADSLSPTGARDRNRWKAMQLFPSGRADATCICTRRFCDQQKGTSVALYTLQSSFTGTRAPSMTWPPTSLLCIPTSFDRLLSSCMLL